VVRFRGLIKEGACDELGALRGKEDRRSGNVFRLAKTAEQDFLREDFFDSVSLMPSLLAC
jgi:hypothetical protein